MEGKIEGEFPGGGGGGGREGRAGGRGGQERGQASVGGRWVRGLGTKVSTAAFIITSTMSTNCHNYMSIISVSCVPQYRRHRTKSRDHLC